MRGKALIMTSIQSRQCKLWLLLAITLAGVAGVMALPPIAQDMNYHLFADQEAWLGVPNF